MQTVDVAIVGAGIVGLATAFQLSVRKPDLRIVVIDKEDGVARHQTGHNSGVIHSGIYYTPGGSKAEYCRKGYRMLLDFCERYEVPFDICGKVIVAVNGSEQIRLDHIYQRGVANGLTGIRKINRAELAEIEPHVKGVEAIWVPQAGITDYNLVARKYLELVTDQGGQALFGAKVLDIRPDNNQMLILTERGHVRSKLVINCAGLYSDRVAKMTIPRLALKILPFRGEYYKLRPEKEYLIRNLVYPVPNPNFPFLGVHFTRMIHGGIEAGPNAVLAFKREGYSRWQIDFPELWETLAYSGFRHLAQKHWQDGLYELQRSFSKKAFVKALQGLLPELTENDVQRGGAGVRAMACDVEGNLADDFLIYEQAGVINVCNAPSPAATASLAIGETVAIKALQQLDS
ncbi:MAG: L-2-hydroxyglutarate oxidase [Saprospiraceae bacterium]|nr:L-2-hydroxyglutarate oxidase [Saprospiraceae bacterium]